MVLEKEQRKFVYFKGREITCGTDGGRLEDVIVVRSGSSYWIASVFFLKYESSLQLRTRSEDFEDFRKETVGKCPR